MSQLLETQPERAEKVGDSVQPPAPAVMEPSLGAVLSTPDLPRDSVLAADMTDAAVTVVVEDVEGLPIQLVRLYAEIAARHAVVRELEPGNWLATVAGIDGAWGDGRDSQEALAELREAIVGWVAVKRRVGAKDIPPMEGIDLSVKP